MGQNQRIGFALVNVTGGLTRLWLEPIWRNAGQHALFLFEHQPAQLRRLSELGREQPENLQRESHQQLPLLEQHAVDADDGRAELRPLGSNYITYAWNDMGGSKDDYDYNDMEYYISCGSSTSGGGGWNGGNNNSSSTSGVVLIK